MSWTLYLEVTNVTEKVLTNVLELLSLPRVTVGGETEDCQLT